MIFISHLNEAWLKYHRKEQLVQKENKSHEEGAELADLQREFSGDPEDKKQLEIMMKSLAGDFGGMPDEQIDFILGAIYGMLLNNLFKSDGNSELLDKKIKFVSSVMVEMRMELFKKISASRFSATEMPKIKKQ